jgi:hypothetical protein
MRVAYVVDCRSESEDEIRVRDFNKWFNRQALIGE